MIPLFRRNLQVEEFSAPRDAKGSPSQADTGALPMRRPTTPFCYGYAYRGSRTRECQRARLGRGLGRYYVYARKLLPTSHSTMWSRTPGCEAGAQLLPDVTFVAGEGRDYLGARLFFASSSLHYTRDRWVCPPVVRLCRRVAHDRRARLLSNAAMTS